MTVDRAVIADSVAHACTESAGTVQALADEVGVSYAALCSWSRGRRRPPPHRLVKLAEVLDSRAERLRELADGLRLQAGHPPRSATRAANEMSPGNPDARSAPGTPREGGAERTALPIAASSRDSARESTRGRAPRSWAEPADRQRTRPGGIPMPPPSR
jgi:hypothetical protein